uniref:Uncharacterized protein n=1 Tax=Anopheles maculatus TaxID=74869 RepID=A0A182SW78_9DIPT
MKIISNSTAWHGREAGFGFGALNLRSREDNTWVKTWRLENGKTSDEKRVKLLMCECVYGLLLQLLLLLMPAQVSGNHGTGLPYHYCQFVLQQFSTPSVPFRCWKC